MRKSPAALHRVPVFFSDQVVWNGGRNRSSQKAVAVVADWRAQKFPLRVVDPPAASPAQLAMAHSRKYVDDILQRRLNNAHGNRSMKIATSSAYSCGAVVAAAREAVRNRRVAAAPVSNFNHACHAEAGGWCTFNGLMVAACVLKTEGAVRRVGILDFDRHHGNGTEDIIRALSADWVRHRSANRIWHECGQAREFLSAIPQILAEMADCDLILYQAGANLHIDDPHTGWLTSEQLLERDRRVFEGAIRLGLPIAWNTGSGYQETAARGLEPVLEIHRNTMSACTEAFVQSNRRNDPDIRFVRESLRHERQRSSLCRLPSTAKSEGTARTVNARPSIRR